MVIPLKNPLELRPTLKRVLRSLDIDVDSRVRGIIGSIIINDYKSKYSEIVIKVNERTTSGKNVKKVCCYPAEYIPRMIEIINEYLNPKPKKIKRPRIAISYKSVIKTDK